MAMVLNYNNYVAYLPISTPDAKGTSCKNQSFFIFFNLRRNSRVCVVDGNFSPNSLKIQEKKTFSKVNFLFTRQKPTPNNVFDGACDNNVVGEFKKKNRTTAHFD